MSWMHALQEAGLGLRGPVAGHLAHTRTDKMGTRVTVDAVVAATTQVIDAFAKGFECLQQPIMCREEAARCEFIDDPHYGRSQTGEFAERTARFGLRRPPSPRWRWLATNLRTARGMPSLVTSNAP
ncbi:hypothetical protein ACIRO1_23690 [Streptomyces sp. NPDC102381]|uniref:hypothetical protein n=1 Tax=Streptomyces sp. NPDC102381 TaxID=3366164 RepID=UPI00381D91BD